MTLKIYYHYLEEPESVFSADHDAVVIGRRQVDGRTVDLDLSPDLRVSRLHAYLFSDQGTWWIRDLKSKHGTFYNGQQVKTQVALEPGCQVRIGDTVMRFDFPDSMLPTIGTREGTIVDERTIGADMLQLSNPVSETERIDILARVAAINSAHQGQAALDALAREVLDMMPKAQRAEVIFYRDKELIPVAHMPPEKSHASFTLARRAVYSSSAFIWERNAASNSSKLVQSLGDTITAIYAPMIYNRQVVGILHVDSTVIGTQFMQSDLKTVSEVAFAAAQLLVKGDVAGEFPSIFISYSHDDRVFIDRLVGDLRRKGVSVWFDERLRAGDEWEEQLHMAIGATDTFVLVMSESSFASKYVQSEIDYAEKIGKNMLPILYLPCTIPDAIAKIQYINIQENYDKGLTDLFHELHRLSE